jgi:hypothetical protein
MRYEAYGALLEQRHFKKLFHVRVFDSTELSAHSMVPPWLELVSKDGTLEIQTCTPSVEH